MVEAWKGLIAAGRPVVVSNYILTKHDSKRRTVSLSPYGAMQARPICCNRKSPCKFGCRNWIISGDSTNQLSLFHSAEWQGWTTSEAARKTRPRPCRFHHQEDRNLNFINNQNWKGCVAHIKTFSTQYTRSRAHHRPLHLYETMNMPTHTIFSYENIYVRLDRGILIKIDKSPRMSHCQ